MQESMEDNYATTTNLYTDIASKHSAKGEYEKAIKWQTQAVTIQERLFGCHDASTIMSFNNLASYDEVSWTTCGTTLSDV